MDWTITSTHSIGIVRIEASGLATVDECERLVNEVLALDAWKAGHKLLIECSKVNIKALRFTEVDRSTIILRNRTPEFGNCKIALIVTPGVGQGIGNQFKFMTESKTDIRVEAFLNEENALLWLSD
jgi:hypothetical protein